MQKIPAILSEKIFQKLFQISEVANLKKEEYVLYEKDLLNKWTEYSVLKTAEEKGMEKGIAEAKEDEVRRLILKLAFTNAQVADVAEVPLNFVKKYAPH